MNRAGGEWYVQYGCGDNVADGWLNFDNSPSLRLRRLPFGRSLSSLIAGRRFPATVRYGDIVTRPLAAENTCAGVYASHVLEHLSRDDAETALRHTFVMLRPGGIFRLIVPDLEARARRYVGMLDDADESASDVFMTSTHLGVAKRRRGIAALLRTHFGHSAHLWMWDRVAMERKLAAIGFVDIRRCTFDDCNDPAFRAVEAAHRFVDPVIGVTELAVECRKPRVAE